MSSDADRIAALEAEVNELRAQFSAIFDVMDRMNERLGFREPPEHTSKAVRKAPRQRARTADAEVIPLRRRAR